MLPEMLRIVAYEMLKKVIGKISGLMVVDFLRQWGDEMEGMCSKMFQLLLLKGLLAEVWKKSKDIHTLVCSDTRCRSKVTFTNGISNIICLGTVVSKSACCSR